MDKELGGGPHKSSDDIKNIVRTIPDAAGRPLHVIAEADALQLAETRNQTLNDVYIAALSRDIWPLRYVRNRETFSAADQIRLAQSRVVMAGCGGLGGQAALMLARLGIGTLVLLDPDRFEETNLNRQTFARSDTLGDLKVEAAAAALCGVNPAVEIRAIPLALTSENVLRFLTGADVVVDGLDNAPARHVVFASARRLNLPFVHGAVAGLEGRVMTFLPDARTESSDLDGLLGSRSSQKAEPPAEAVLGTPVMAPVFIACLQVMEAVNIILKRKPMTAGPMLHADLATGQFGYFDLT